LNYPESFAEVKSVGADEGGPRTPAETEIGIFWAYDGAFKIGAPPKLYLQVVDAILDKLGDDERVDGGFEVAKVYASVSVAIADAAIQCWKEKYAWSFARPVVGIRLADNDSYPDTSGDPTWTPLGSPLTNTARDPTNPPFPAYPSGHATMGTAAMTAVSTILGLGNGFSFPFVSDEYNGENGPEVDGQIRPRPRREKTLTVGQVIEENKSSRIYLGVHWDFDSEQGSVIGEGIGSAVASWFPERG
jgi:hypothetical protein